jgi:hypothetical protein
MKETNKSLSVVGDISPILNILDSTEAQQLVNMRDELIEAWDKKQIFRTETEMLSSVLNDFNHPTNASKYWQCIREQTSMLDSLIYLSFDIRKNALKIEKLSRKLAKTTDDLEQMGIQIKLDQLSYEKASYEQVAKDRIREIKLWSKIKDQINDGTFDDQDVNTHQIEALHRILLVRANRVTENTDFNEVNNIIGPLLTMERLKEEGVISSTPEEHLLRQSKEQQLLQNKK